MQSLHQNICALPPCSELGRTGASGATKASIEEERADGAEVHCCFFNIYQRCFVKGLWSPNLQQLFEVTDGFEVKVKAPFE